MGDGSFPSAPYLRLAGDDGVGARAAIPCLVCAAGVSSWGNLNEAEKKGRERRASVCGKDLEGRDWKAELALRPCAEKLLKKRDK